MTSDDTEWVRRLLSEGVVCGPVLELGVGYGGATCRSLVLDAGLKYYGTDIEKTPAVDFVADFERIDEMKIFATSEAFGSVLVLNVLEHTFDPIRILDNAISLLRPGGRCVVVTPCVWPLHTFPVDVWRPLPNFYEEYAHRRNLTLETKSFEYVGRGPVLNFRGTDGKYRFPSPGKSKIVQNWSRVVHRLFNTTGRLMLQPSHLAIGAVFQKAEQPLSRNGVLTSNSAM